MNRSDHRDRAAWTRSCGNKTARGRGWRLRLQAAAVAAAAALLILGTAAAQPAQAQVESVLHSFSWADGTGANPEAGLIRDSQGNLYGTTYQGGTNGVGVVFEEVYDSSTHSYTEKTLLSFDGSNGSYPTAGLVRDSSGNLYGTTKSGGASGYGTVFELLYNSSTESYTPQVLFSFDALSENGVGAFVNGTGANPQAGLARDSAGNLYGTTVNGGAYSYGTVFELSPPAASGANWTEKVLYSFQGNPDGEHPEAGLITDSQGNLYGTTYDGGASGDGAVFELVYDSSTQSYTERSLFSFNYTGGANPDATLTRDSAGNLYGATVYGGASGYGTVYELTQASGYATEKVLQNFTGGNGSYPRAGLVLDSSENLYGATYNGGANSGGTVFELTQASGYQTENVLHNFRSGSDGANPRAKLLMDPSGNLYGATYLGGSSSAGTFFGIAPVTLSASSLDFGAVGVGSSASQSVTLTNYGGGNLSFGTASISGTGAGDFAIGATDTCSGQTVAAGASCTVSVSITPTTAATETASLGLMEGGIPVTVALTGSGASVAATLSPSSLAFPHTLAGAQSAPQQVTLTNTSAGSALTIDSIGVSTGFTEGAATCGSSLAAGASCTINVAFTPTAAGSLAGTLTVTDNAAGSPQTVSLSGSALTPVQYIQNVMVSYVESLGLNHGRANSLVKELNSAVRMISAGKINGAIGSLESFITEVNDLDSSGAMTQQQAATLVSEANAVISALE